MKRQTFQKVELSLIKMILHSIVTTFNLIYGSLELTLFYTVNNVKKKQPFLNQQCCDWYRF